MCSCHGSHLLSAFCLCFAGSLLSQHVMVPISSSASTVSSIDDSSEHNLWNPLLELLFLKHANFIVDSYLVELYLAEIALSCRFDIDLLWPTSDGSTLQPRLPHRVSTTTSSTMCGILYWNCFSSSMRLVSSTRISWKPTWSRSLTLHLIYSATKKVRLILLKSPLNITFRGVSLFGMAPLPSL